MQVPFVDLKAQYLSIKPAIDQAIEDILLTTSFVGGPMVKTFEQDFARYLGIDHCLGCGNGTDAIEIVLKAMGVGVGDEVIVPAMSWISTAEAVSSVGAKPIFVDILAASYTLDPAQLEMKISAKTKAVMPVHLYGCLANMDQIMSIAKKNGLKVIEDAAQAIGSKTNGKMAGTIADVATFSFYPGKNLGAYGDAGAVVTNDSVLAEKCRMIANHGQKGKHNHEIEGRNSRLDTIQAAVLSVKLKHIENWTEARISHAKYYDELLKDLDVIRPQMPLNSRHAFHVYAIQVEKRDVVKRKLAEAGIATQIHYPRSLPELLPYQREWSSDDFPIAIQLGRKGLSLPMYPELKREQIECVVEHLRKILA